MKKNRVKGTFSTLRREPGLKKLFQKMFHLVFEVIVQPPKHTYEMGFFPSFSSLWLVIFSQPKALNCTTYYKTFYVKWKWKYKLYYPIGQSQTSDFFPILCDTSDIYPEVSQIYAYVKLLVLFQFKIIWCLLYFFRKH